MMTRKLRREIFWRSLFLQSAWNERGMQNLGFSWCMNSWLRRLYKAGDPRGPEAARRYLEFFNTQPYMAGIVVGVVGQLEETLAHSGKKADERIGRLKSAMGASLAAIGDKFFWGTLRPLCGLLALAVWLFLREKHAPPLWVPAAAMAAYLALFNALACRTRWQGVDWGYRWGESIAVELKRLNWQHRTRQARRLGLVIALALALAAVFSQPFDGRRFLFRTAVLGACVVVKSFRFSALRGYAVALACGVLIALGGWAP